MTIRKFLELRDKGITLDLLYVLSLIGEGKDLSKMEEMSVFLESLEAMKLIEKGKLADEGKTLLKELGAEEIKKDPTINSTFYEDLHARLKAKMKELTGSEQKNSRINKSSKSYAFIPSKVDLQAFLVRFFRRYGYRDKMELIEQYLMNYITTCYKENQWFPLLKYYIIHEDKGSLLATDLESHKVVEEVEETQTQRFL